METKGTHVFSRSKNMPPASELSTVLEKSHMTVTLTIDTDKQDVALRPLRPSERTWMVHPSPVSQAALDFVFQSQMASFSPYSADLFRHLGELKKSFTLFVLADLLFALHRHFRDLFVARKPATPLADPTEERTAAMWECCNLIISTLDDIGFVERIDALGSDFERAVKMYWTLGVVPMTVNRNRNNDN